MTNTIYTYHYHAVIDNGTCDIHHDGLFESHNPINCAKYAEIKAIIAREVGVEREAVRIVTLAFLHSRP